jgi:hypothetical protein
MAILGTRFSLAYFLLSGFFSGTVWSQQYIISTVAGGVAPPTPVAAATASVGDPARVAVDAAGNVYFSSLHSVFKVDGAGTLPATRVTEARPPARS